MAKISFIIPTRDRGYIIGDTLRSLLAQTEPDWEAIVVDDFSTDNTRQVVRGFKDPRIRYHKLPEGRGGGVASARNYGNMIASSNLLAVLDSDDLAVPERTAIALKSYQQHKWDFFSGGRLNLDMQTGEIGTNTRILPNEWDEKRFKGMHSNYVTHSTVVYTKQAALEIPYNSALPCLIDYDLISRFISSKKKIHFSPEIMVIWRRHDNTLTRANAYHGVAYKKAIRTWRGWDKGVIDIKELIQ